MERTKTTRRLWLAGVGIVVALVVVAIWREWPRERLLMEVARPVVKVDAENTSVCWLTLHQLLFVTTQQEASLIENQNGSFTWKDWQGTADVLDTTLHRIKHLTGLTKVLNHVPNVATSGPHMFEVSPDGMWLLWETAATGDGWPHPHAARLDGSHYRDWYRNRNEDKFFLDSHHLVQMTERDPTTMLDLLDKKKDRQFSQAAQTQATLSQYSAQHPIFVMMPYQEYNSAKDVVEVATYRTQDRLQLIQSEGSDISTPEPVQEWKLKLPPGTTYQSGAVSPQQQSVFYVVLTSRLPFFLACLHRIFPNFNPKPTATEWNAGAKE